MIEKITDHNLERYDSRLKEWCDRKFFEKGNYGKYETTEESSAVAFYPAPNTPLEGKVKFSFKETPPASGDKSPTNPSAISGVSSFHVGRGNKNLFYNAHDSGLAGATAIFTPDGFITINGTTTGSGIITAVLPFLPAGFVNKTLTFSMNNPVIDSHVQFRWGNSIGLSSCDAVNKTKTVTFTGANPVAFQIRLLTGNTYNSFVCRPQVELGDAATAFEISEQTAYTIDLNGTYYGGEIDLATGVMTVTWYGEYISTAYNVTEVYTNTIAVGIEATKGHEGSVLDIKNFLVTDKFPSEYGNADSEHCRFSGGSGVPRKVFNIYVNKSRLDISGAVDPSSPTTAEWLAAAKVWMENNPVFACYKLFTPYTVQLTPQQILSLSQTDKYTPRLNTVYTDADSIQISYLKSPIRDEYEKTQAILSLGGNS